MNWRRPLSNFGFWMIFFFIWESALCAPSAVAVDLQVQEVQQILKTAESAKNPGERVVLISAQFLGKPYRSSTLSTGPEQPERLIVNLSGVDCLTLLDYVESLRRSSSSPEFLDNLIAVRYRDGKVSWRTRRHFFTDWADGLNQRIHDVTKKVGGSSTLEDIKTLNRRADGGRYLQDIPVKRRHIDYIPVEAIGPAILGRMQPGDYLGFYTPKPGLDVSHTGIVVEQDGRIFLRHASSQPGIARVVDTPLLSYLNNQNGVVVLRPY